MKSTYLIRIITGASLMLCACDSPSPAPVARPGEPLPDLTQAQLRTVEEGRALFTRTFTVAEGVGPTFNEPRCVSCHDLPTPGGAGADPVRKATRFADGRCELLLEQGGDMLQNQVTEALRERGFGPEAPPPGSVISEVMPPALYGAGLVEAIPDEAILEHADPDDRDGDGISGRPGPAEGGRVGRFGWKAGFATVRDFVGSAFLGEMGLTTPGFPQEAPIGPHALPAGVDPAPDPELDEETVGRVVEYVRMLALPAPTPLSPATRDSLAEGARVFERLGCAACHVPELRTGDSDVEALGNRRVALYSDLLLHDMGEENASICAPGAEPAEWRTAPLAGLRLRLKFWHDGRARSPESAIRAHGGEGAPARDRFIVLTEAERSALLRFLASL
jgi:CxxC motif-containing protein (DUF1111 family)